MTAYPRYFLPLLWTGLGLLVLSGVLLTPGLFELRLEWDVAWSLPGGSRTVVAALHGLCAMLLLVIVGALLPMHVRAGLKRARNFASGIVLLTTLTTLAVSGWAIYYVVNEQLSTFASLLHLGAGLLSLVPLVIHAVQGRRLRKLESNLNSVATFTNQRRSDKRAA